MPRRTLPRRRKMTETVPSPKKILKADSQTNPAFSSK